MKRQNLLFELHGGRAPSMDGRELVAALAKIAQATGLQVLGSQYHDFQPHGATAALLLSESHLTAHTWPEEDYAAIDLFTCKADTRAAEVLAALRGAFEPREIEMHRVDRA